MLEVQDLQDLLLPLVHLDLMVLDLLDQQDPLDHMDLQDPLDNLDLQDPLDHMDLLDLLRPLDHMVLVRLPDLVVSFQAHVVSYLHQLVPSPSCHPVVLATCLLILAHLPEILLLMMTILPASFLILPSLPCLLLSSCHKVYHMAQDHSLCLSCSTTMDL